jgi:methionyl-tRNA formyltransferase
MYRTTFIGYESPYLDTLKQYSDLQLIVTEKVCRNVKKYFGSSFDYAKYNNIRTIIPEDYIKNPIDTDIIVVSGYPRLIPTNIINHPQKGIINIHQSLLPAYRGRHPLNWAIINGEEYTGITIHYINERFDDGKIIYQEGVKIGDEDTTMDVYHKTIEKGKKLLRIFLSEVAKGNVKSFRQNKEFASYYPPRKPKDGRINWKEPAVKIESLIRALVEPYPGAYFYSEGRKVIIDKARILKICRSEEKRGKPFVLNGRLIVKTGEGFLEILKIRNRKFNLSRLVSCHA